MLRLIILYFLLSISNLIAQEIHDLFNADNLILNYNEVVQTINPGDAIILDENRMIENIQIIPTDGQNSIIYKGVVNGKEQILRLPKSSNRTSMLNEYIDGEKILAENNVRITSINESKRNCFILQDFYEFKYSAVDLFLNENLEASLQSEMTEKLRNINFNLSKFEEIGDFKWEQLLWDEKAKDWILVDWDKNTKLSDDPIKNNFLAKYFNIEAIRLSEVVEDEKVAFVLDRIKQVKTKVNTKFAFDIAKILKGCL